LQFVAQSKFFRVTNGRADNLSGTSAVPQIPDDFGAPLKSAEVATTGLMHRSKRPT
jgi:hypothetical protein